MANFTKNETLRCFVGECVGTGTLICFGAGVVAASLQGVSMLGIHIGWALGVFFGVMLTANISGAHINPAVTIPLAVFGKFPWRKVPIYLAAQLIGAFFGAALVFLMYLDTIYHVDPRLTVPNIWYGEVTIPTAGIFSTYPLPFMNWYTCIIQEAMATIPLLMIICYLGDERNDGFKLPGVLKTAIVALMVLGIGNCFGVQTGYAINPARDFGPRLFTACVYGKEVFSSSHYYFFIPIIAPLIGGLMGVGMYEGLRLFVPEPAKTSISNAKIAAEDINTPTPEEI